MSYVPQVPRSKQVLDRQYYTWIIKEGSNSCAVPWLRFQSHPAGGWTFIKLDCSFRLPMFPDSCFPSPEIDENLRMSGTFWGLRYLTHWQYHFLKICFYLFVIYDLCLHILSKNICCNSPMRNLLGSIVFDTC